MDRVNLPTRKKILLVTKKFMEKLPKFTLLDNRTLSGKLLNRGRNLLKDESLGYTYFETYFGESFLFRHIK